MENPFDNLEKRLELIERKIDEILKSVGSTNSKPTTTWLTSKQLAEHLGVSVTAVTNLRGSKIPFYKIGGKILFKKEEIDEYIAKTRHKTGSEYLADHLSKTKM